MRLLLWNKPPGSAGAAAIGAVEGWQRAAQFGLDGDDSLTFNVALDAPYANELIWQRVVVPVFASGAGPDAYDAYRIIRRTLIADESGEAIQVVARGIPFDLVLCGPMALLNSDGTRTVQYTAQKTPLQWIADAIATAAASGFTHFGVGTCDFTAPVTLTLDGSNPMGMLRRLRDQTNTGELVFQRVGALWLIHLVTSWTPAVDPLRQRSGVGLASQRIDEDGLQSGTVLWPEGGAGPNERLNQIGDTRFVVTNVAPGTNRITVASVDGDPLVRMAAFDGQWNGYVVVQHPGQRRFAILDTFATTQQLQVSSVVKFVIGDRIEIREAAPVARRYDVLSLAVAGRPNGGLLRLNALASNVLTPVKMHAGTTDIVPSTNFGVGLFVEGAPLVHTNTSNVVDAATQRLTLVTPTTAVQQGDIGFVHFLGAEPYNFASFNGAPFRVRTVVSTTILELDPLSSTTPVVNLTQASAGYNVRFYRPRGLSARVESSNSGAKTFTVDDAAAAGLAVNDAVLIYSMAGGNLVRAMPSPAAQAAYGISILPVRRKDLSGRWNLLGHADPWLRLWTDPATPTRYVKTGTITRGTATGSHGPYVAILSGTNPSLTTQRVEVHPANFGTRIYVRARVQLPIGWDADVAAEIQISLPDNLQLFRFIGPSTPVPAPGSFNAVVVVSGSGQWVTLNGVVTIDGSVYGSPAFFEGAGNAFATYGGRVTIATATANVIVDALEIQPGDAPEADDDLLEFGSSQQLWGAMTAAHPLLDEPLTQHTITIADLYGVDPAQYPDFRSLLGREVVINNARLRRTDVVRIVAVRPNYEQQEQTELILNAKRQTLERLLALSFTP